MRLPQFSSILYSDFPSNKPSSYWLLGTSIYGNTHVHTCIYIYIYIERMCVPGQTWQTGYQTIPPFLGILVLASISPH